MSQRINRKHIAIVDNSIVDELVNSGILKRNIDGRIEGLSIMVNHTLRKKGKGGFTI